MPPPTFRDMLKNYIADRIDVPLIAEPGYTRWNKKLCAFFERWQNTETDNELWSGIAADAEKYGLSREISFFRIASSAAWALLAGDPANVKNFSPTALQLQRERSLDLARCAQSLANHYRAQLRALGPDQRSEALAQLYEREAEIFRLSADAKALRGAGRYQSRGKKFAREQLSFMRDLVISMRCNFGKPYYEAVAAITNIAYQRADVVTAEEVRTACRGLPRVDRLPEPTPEIAEAFRQGVERCEENGSGKLDTK